MHRWYYKDVSRPQAESILKQCEHLGCFLVRDSATSPGQFSLSLFTQERYVFVLHFFAFVMFVIGLGFFFCCVCHVNVRCMRDLSRCLRCMRDLSRCLRCMRDLSRCLRCMRDLSRCLGCMRDLSRCLRCMRDLSRCL